VRGLERSAESFEGRMRAKVAVKRSAAAQIGWSARVRFLVNGPSQQHDITEQWSELAIKNM
jgi:hypothetical protein